MIDNKLLDQIAIEILRPRVGGMTRQLLVDAFKHVEAQWNDKKNWPMIEPEWGSPRTGGHRQVVVEARIRKIYPDPAERKRRGWG